MISNKNQSILNQRLQLLVLLFILFIEPINCTLNGEIERKTCAQDNLLVLKYRKRLHALREQMLIRASLQQSEIDAYIIPAFDEHQNIEVAYADQRLQYLTGFTGTNGYAVVTLKSAAFWTDEQYIQQALDELNCDWLIFLWNNTNNIPAWLETQVNHNSRIGSDPRLIPHFMWIEWESALYRRYLKLVKINNNLIDIIWDTDRPKFPDSRIRIQEIRFAGINWIKKIDKLRKSLENMNCDAIVITSLTEIAYILNIRGRDLPYTPVIKAYLIVTRDQILLYTNREKVTLGTILHLRSDLCHNDMCVLIKDYNQIWQDLRTFSQIWKRVMLPTKCVYDLGVSEAIFTTLQRTNILEHISPIIFMRAEKNEIEKEGMIKAHIKDGAAICDVMSYLEERYLNGEKWTELSIKHEVERSRKSQERSQGISFETVVAFGKHGSIPHFIPSNVTDIYVTDESTLIIDSGGQYLEGTTDVTRTFHFGKPTNEQKQAYTSVLAGIIRLINLKFPEMLRPSEIDTLSRSPVWDSMSDYPHGTGHGIGSYLSVKESPIEISYNTNGQFLFKEGYFFSNEPGFYKINSFGIRLGNVLEVYDTHKKHPSGANFLAFRDVTLVPYEPKLIDGTLLSSQEKRWLNKYNAKIRSLVGEELKRQGNMQAFYWMMNKTRHIREYLPEEEYRRSNSITQYCVCFTLQIIILIYIFVSFIY